MADTLSLDEADRLLEQAKQREAPRKVGPSPPGTMTLDEADQLLKQSGRVPQMLTPPMPSFGERFSTNAGEAFRHTIVGDIYERGQKGEFAEQAHVGMERAASQARAAKSDAGLERFEDGTPSPYAGIPVKMLDTMAKQSFIQSRNLEQQHNIEDASRQAYLNAMPPWYEEQGFANKLLGATAAVGGSLVGSMASPESWIGPGKAAGTARKVGETIGELAVRRGAKGAATQAPLNAGFDVLSQTLEMNRGERESFDPAETARAAAMGGAIGAVMGAGSAPFARRPERAGEIPEGVGRMEGVQQMLRETPEPASAHEHEQIITEALAPTMDGLELGDAAGAYLASPAEEMGELAMSRGMTPAQRSQQRQRSKLGKQTTALAQAGAFDAPQGLGLRALYHALRETFAPSNMGPYGVETSGLVRDWNARLHNQTDQAMKALRGFTKLVDGMDGQARRRFFAAMEDPTVPFDSPEIQRMGEVLRGMLDKIAAKLTSAGLLEKARANYFPHYWKDPQRAANMLQQLEDEWRKQMARTPVRGSGSFLKRRTIDVIETGLQKGLELKTDNPLELVALKLWEENRYLYMHQMMEEMKDRGIAVFFKRGAHIPSGMTALRDPGFEAWLPPAVVEHFMTFDPSQRRDLERIAAMLGPPVHIVDRLKADDPHFSKEQGLRGYTMHPQANPQRASAPPGIVASRFGNAITTLMHEIGHQLDWKFGLSGLLSRDPVVWRELAHLALLRSSGRPSLSYAKYLLLPEERIANLFHAYWHAPEVLEQYAPHAKQALEQLAQNNTPVVIPGGKITLQQVLDMVKPSLRSEEATRTQVVPGSRYLGQWYAPVPAARIFNNFAQSNGAYGGKLFEFVRKMSMQMNLLQLGLSGFHVLFEANDAGISGMAKGIDQIAAHGEVARGIGQIAKSATGVVPFGAPQVETWRKGQKLLTGLLDPQSAPKELRPIIAALIYGGGRSGMDPFWRGINSGSRSGHGMGGFLSAIKQNRLPAEIADMFRGKTLPQQFLQIFNIGFRAIETSTDLIMSEFVPRMKLGVFYDAAEDWIRHNPNADLLTMRREMGKLWDAVEDRMGLMTYDNIFWSKALKNTGFLLFRAVGWNLGTWRALGGAIFDFALNGKRMVLRDPRAEWTRRMSYAPSLAVMGFLQGSMLCYMMTGQWPTSLLDAYFPPTGRKTPYGTPERLSIPGYIKDVIEVFHDPLKTLQNKLHPMYATGLQLYNNRDYYGGLIHDPLDSAIEQYTDVGKWLAQQYLPFTIRSYGRMRAEGDSAMFASLMSLMGLQPAPASISAPERQERWQLQQDRIARRRRHREEARGLR